MNVNALLAAAIHERYSDGRVHAPCDHTSGGECERFADVLLATPSGQALVAHVTALETALRDIEARAADQAESIGLGMSGKGFATYVHNTARAALEGVEP